MLPRSDQLRVPRLDKADAVVQNRLHQVIIAGGGRHCYVAVGPGGIWGVAVPHSGCLQSAGDYRTVVLLLLDLLAIDPKYHDKQVI